MASWHQLRLRLIKNKTIDKEDQKQFDKEREHWRNVLSRIISIVKFLGKHNLAFRGSNEKLHVNSNGNFLGLIEMLEEFDPVIQEHISRITNNDIHHHYLGHGIQNELILMLATSIKSEIVKKIKQAKYFSVMLDCTPDTSHQEKMTMILRYVSFSSTGVHVEESFLGFLNVKDTTGCGLFDVLQLQLESLGLDIDDVRGQGYDNGSNMKGQHNGVQSRFLKVNPRAFYTPCDCHSLNLILCDMVNTCPKAKTFFGVIQRLYTIFANSIKRWEILKDNVKGLTLKPLATTRWESRIDSVKAIRFQIKDIREALQEVAEVDLDSMIRSEADSLAEFDLGKFEFLLAIVIWFDLLSHVNVVSKRLQKSDMLIDVAIEEIENLVSFFEEYRENGFCEAVEIAKEIAIDLGVEPIFPQKCAIKKKKQFDENRNDTPELSQEESYRVNYFLYIIDQAIQSLRGRFEQYQEYKNLFGFLFTSEKLHSLDDIHLKSCCMRLEDALEHNEHYDIDGESLYVELKLVRQFMPNRIMRAIEILSYLKDVGCFPNSMIAYRILLTIPVTVASAERSFSKLKLVKSYMRSTMSQDRLNGLETIAIENDMLDKISYEELIDDFASKSARRVALFK